MSVTVRQFRIEFPEFRGIDNAVIQRGLADANLQINREVWGDKSDAGQKYLAADLIASGPLGEKARLSKNDKTTVYLEKYMRLMRQVTAGVGRNT